jgi:hypothetical protein
MVYCVKKTSLECPDRMNISNLVGTICYYPKNGEFYFCGYDTFPVKHNPKDSQANKSNRMMVFKIICNLCSITEGTTEYDELLKQIEDIDGIFIDKFSLDGTRYGPSEFGKLIDSGLIDALTGGEKIVHPYLYDKHVKYCIKLTSGIFNQMTLKWIKYIVEVVSNPKHTVDIPITLSDRTTKEIKICTLSTKPQTLADISKQVQVPVVNNKPSITLFQDDENAVLLNGLTDEELKVAHTYARKPNKEKHYSGEVFSHFGMIGWGVSDDDVLNKASTLYSSYSTPSEEYTQCSTASIPSSQ